MKNSTLHQYKSLLNGKKAGKTRLFCFLKGLYVNSWGREIKSRTYKKDIFLKPDINSNLLFLILRVSFHIIYSKKSLLFAL